MIWVNQIVQGVLLGGYYAVIACGLSFMFSVMRIINLAHGSLAIVAAFGLFVLADQFGVAPLTGLLIVLPAMALIGWVLQRAVLERSRRGGVLTPILSTFGLSIVIDNLLFQRFGADTRSLGPYLDDLSYDSWSLTDDIIVGKLAVYTFVAAVVPNSTTVAPVKLVPVIVTNVPPTVGPEVGLRPVTVGASAAV